MLPPAPAEPDEADAEPAEPDPRRGRRAGTDPLQFADVAPAFRDQVAKYGSDRMAFPYGGSALVLVYDRAAFEREANREAAEAGIARAGAAQDLGAARRTGPVLPGA